MSKPGSHRNVAFAALALVAGIVAGSGVIAATAHAEEATAPAEAPAKVDKAAARELFESYSCSACHALADAGAMGVVGPSLDDPSLTREFIIGRVTNGQGAMPSFNGQISDAEIAQLADYIVAVNHEPKPAG